MERTDVEVNTTRLTRYDYQISKQADLHLGNVPFYALIAVLMRRADSDNLELLKAAFPNIWADLQARYSAPGGKLDTD